MSTPTNLTEASKGCLLLTLWDRDATNVISWSQKNIPEEDLFDDGYEREPHVTVLYGFSPDLDPEEVVDACAGFGKVAIKLGKITRFEQDDHDVLKIDVHGDSIHQLHALMRAVFEDDVEVSFPDYKPHLTLAYVEKGACADLNGSSAFEGQVFVFDTAVYSTPGSAQRFFAVLDA